MKKLISILIAVVLLLCACAQGSSDDNTVSRSKKDTFSPSWQKVESSIFGRNISYDGFTPAENISLPIESVDILDMLQIEKTLYFLTDGAIYTLDIESGASGKLFDTDAAMFASYGDTFYTYAPESGKLCTYSAGGEMISETDLLFQKEKVDIQLLFVTDDYYAFKCYDKSGDVSVEQYNTFDRETLELTNSFNEKVKFGCETEGYSTYKRNSILKAEDNPENTRSVIIYELDLEKGKFTKLIKANISYDDYVFDFVYNPNTDTVVFFAAPKPRNGVHFVYHGDVTEEIIIDEPKPAPMFICEYSMSDPDNIVHKKFYHDNTASDNVYVTVHENVISAVSSAESEYKCFDYLNPPESITLACAWAGAYEDVIFGFEAETGILVRTVDYSENFDRLDIKLMAGDTDFDLFEPVYYNQHKYFLADMFEDLSKYEGLKRRLDGDLAAGYVSNLDGKYVGIPTGMQNIGTKDAYPEDGSQWTYSKMMSRLLYLAQNIDVADGVYKDGDGEELYKLLRYLYDYPEGNEAKMPFGKEINVLSNGFILMNPSGTHKENTIRFLEYMFDALNGDIEGVVPEYEQYLDLDSTDDVYLYWRIYAWDYVGPIYEAANNISKCDGKNSTIKEIAREAAAEVRMRLME